MRKKTALLLCLITAVLLAPQLQAQNPTGTLTGRVTDDDGGALPGVTVHAASESVQGDRSTQTGVNGDYKLAFLPPGTYTVTYELEGFKSINREVKLSAAQTTVSDISMELGTVTEEIVVTGQQASISEVLTGATNVTSAELESLPVDRDLAAAIQLVPGVHNTGPGASAEVIRLSISGAMSFENLWLINGVVINENVRGTILPLFIEDAIQETTTAVSGVSAEYGRFTGGVVNAITKSGGNQFDGSLRLNLSNDDWTSRTPLSPERIDQTNESYEGTFGGYLWKDHIWFFTAARDRSLSDSDSTPITNITFPTTDEQRRLEGKLTLTPVTGHSLIGSYLEIDQTATGTVFGSVLDLRSVNANREDPQEIKSINYNGVLTPELFIEGQFSQRDFVIGRGSGGVPDLIEGTLIRTQNQDFRYWAPTFCGSCEDQMRNNENLLAKGSYFLSTEGAGTHDLVFGYDTFEDSIFSINHQTGSDFTVYGTDVIRDASGNIALDSTDGSPFPVFDPNTTGLAPWIRWFAVFNEDLARPTSFKTNSFYVNDRWQLNDKWSFNVGVRWDENDGQNSAGASVADDSKISPRLGLSYDLRADGDLVFNASYGTYVAAIVGTGNVGDGSSSGGAIGDFRWDYAGPPINVDAGCLAAGTCITSPEALEIIFDWYRSQGGVFSLDQLNPDAPINDFLNLTNVPGATTQIRDGVKSPAADEITFGITKRLGSRGLFRADVVHREWTDFYTTITTLETGQVETPNGLADLSLIGNFANDLLKREYNGLHTQFRYRFTDRLTVAGNYTLSQTKGNADGETTASGPVTFTPLRYPEYREARWNYPEGDLLTDQRHRARLWATYSLIDNDHHKLDVSLLQSFHTGQPYAANANINPRNFVNNPGYRTPPTAVTYYFTDRDAFRTDDVTSTDLAFNYSFIFSAFGRELEVFLQPEVINLFNEDAVIDPNGLDDNEGVSLGAPFNPFTGTPVEGTNFTRNANFGQPLNEDDFQEPRTFRLSVGFRF